MSERFVLEGNLFSPPDSPRAARLTISSGRIQSVEPIEAGSAGTFAPGRDAPPPVDGRCFRPASDQWILPGFVDAHTHLLGLGLAPLKPDLSGARSRDEAFSMLDGWLRENPGEGPVIAEGFDQSAWTESRLPTRAELDRVSPRRAVAMRRVCGHIAVFNSAAVALLGADAAGLDADSGLARESLPLSLSRRWPPSEAEHNAAIDCAQTAAHRAGVTSVHEMGSASGFRVFARAAISGHLRLRVSYFFEAALLEPLVAVGMRPGFGDDFLRAAGLKLFLDGSIGGRSAALRTPYSGGNERGLLLWEDEALEKLLGLASGEGWPVAMHAIGDRAIEQGIAAVERLRGKGVEPGPPGPRLEHAEMLDDSLCRRAAEAGFLLSMQPNFTARWQGTGQLYEAALGSERAARLNPYAAAATTGRLLFGSDTMPMGPFFGLSGALGHPLAKQRLSFPQALGTYTRSGAAAVSRPFGRGQILPGEPADLILVRLPAGPGDLSAADLARAQVLATWVGGTVVHADPAVAASLSAAL